MFSFCLCDKGYVQAALGLTVKPSGQWIKKEIEEKAVVLTLICFPGFSQDTQNGIIKMAQMTMIARVVDGLPLVGTMQDDEQVIKLNYKLRV